MPNGKFIYYLSVLLFFGALLSCEPVVPQQTTVSKIVVYDNYNYEDIVGNVNFVPALGEQINALENAVMILGQRESLRLEFDLLVEEMEYLSAKIYHCNKDWNRSRLQDLEFLDKLNNFRINESFPSLNTFYKYVNYRFDVPVPSISGNYVVGVFRRSNPDDLLLTRRFFVVNNLSIVNTQSMRSTTVAKRKLNQQVEISVDYGKVQVNRPFEDIAIVVMQNHNWNTLKSKIEPTLIRPNESFVEYRPIGQDLNFPGRNEFRFFDLRTIDVTGRNINGIARNEDGISAIISVDESKFNKSYSLDFRDINGKHLTENNDSGRSFLSSDYVKTKFQLAAEPIDGRVYVIGRFNDWKLNDISELFYDKKTGMYTTDILLKQGYYEYTYWVESNTLPSYYFEGSHFETENDYEVFVYYRQPGTIHDQIIGYKKFGSIVN